MKNGRFSCFVFVSFFILLLTACDSTGSTAVPLITPERSRPTITNPDTQDTPALTDTPDPQEFIEAATILAVDFEHGYPPELFDWSRKWFVEMENDTNSMFCNELSDDWTSVFFGMDVWQDYVIQLRMKFLSTGEGQEAETLIRVNTDTEGYRVNLSGSGWAHLAYYPPYADLGSSSVTVNQDEWVRVQLQAAGENLKYFFNGDLVIEASDNTRTSGRAAFNAAPGTQVCVDDILVWALDENGYPDTDPGDLVIEPYDGSVYSIAEKIDNRPTIPVFYPWSGGCGQLLWFDCDMDETPYGLVWIGAGISQEIDSTEPTVSPAQRIRMLSDPDTLYLVSEEWHYWNLGWRYLSPDSEFYLDEVFSFHEGSEYGRTLMINFEHPQWPGVLAEKAINYRDAGFDGMMLDWWHNNAGNGRSEERVEKARLAIAKAIRTAVGDEFILLGNVNWGVDDPTALYLSGVFLELWKQDPASEYSLTYEDEGTAGGSHSIERMEDLLLYWDANLQPPKIIAFEPWKVTTGDYIADRTTEENIRYAKLFTAMGVVIPENGYVLYADNNDDWDGGDHQHAYYEFYHTDFGKPVSDMVVVRPGIVYKRFERGLIAYNRTESEAVVRLPYGQQFRIGPLEGLFLEGYYE